MFSVKEQEDLEFLSAEIAEFISYLSNVADVEIKFNYEKILESILDFYEKNKHKKYNKSQLVMQFIKTTFKIEGMGKDYMKFKRLREEGILE